MKAETFGGLWALVICLAGTVGVMMDTRLPSSGAVHFRGGIGHQMIWDYWATNPTVVQVEWQTNIGWDGITYDSRLRTNDFLRNW